MGLRAFGNGLKRKNRGHACALIVGDNDRGWWVGLVAQLENPREKDGKGPKYLWMRLDQAAVG